MKEEQRIMGLEKLGLRDKSKGNEIVDLSFILIDWIPQSVVALYIYRVGGLAPQEILLQDLCNTRFIKGHKQSNHIRARIKSHVYTQNEQYITAHIT